MNRRPSVLVTGAGGFVGQALCPFLEAEGFTLRRSSRQAEGAGRIGEVGPQTDWRAALAGMETVVHLAGLAHVPHGEGEEAEARYRAINARGTEALAEAAAKAGVKRFVFLSSATVMGTDSGGGVWTEADEPAPANAYARSKLEAEARLRDVAERGGMEWVALRPPLVYGPGVKANFLKLMTLAASGLPLPLASLKNRRRLLALPNLCGAVALASTHPGAANAVFFIGDAEEVSTPELLRRLAAALGSRSLLLPYPPSWLRLMTRLIGKQALFDRLAGDFRFSDAAFRERCRWRPPVAMEQALKQTVEWYRNTA